VPTPDVTEGGESPEPADEAETCRPKVWFMPWTWFNTACAAEEKTVQPAEAAPAVASTMTTA
jgi:hypothetical protein